MSDDLKPCPFCGGEASEIEDFGHSTAYEVGCFNGDCPIEPHVWEATKAEAISAWNTRANDDHIEELETKLAKVIEIAGVFAGSLEYDYHGNILDEEERKAKAALDALTASEEKDDV